MAIVSLASAKGGVGKTTTAVNLAVEMGNRGISVVILDCDINQHASQFFATFGKTNPACKVECRGGLTKSGVVEMLADSSNFCDVVIVDLPAGTTDMSLRAVQMSNLVVVPSQKTVVDVRDAMRTAMLVADAQRLSHRTIHAVLLWSRVSARFETLTERAVRGEFMSIVGDPDTAALRTFMLEYDAYQAGFYGGWVPSQLAHAAPGSTVTIKGTDGRATDVIVPRSAANAAANVAAITTEVLERLQAIGDGTVGSGLTISRDVAKKMSEMPEALDA